MASPRSCMLVPGFAASDVTVLNAGGGNIEVTGTYSYQPLIGSALPIFGGESVPTNFT